MKPNTNELDRRTYLKTAGAATAGMMGLAGCASDSIGGSDGGSDGGDGETQYGTLSTAVTDQPSDIGDFEELIVTIDGIWLKPAGGEGDDGDEDDDEDTDSETPDGTEEPETEEPEEPETTETEEPETEEPETEEPEETETEEPETEDGEETEEPEDGEETEESEEDDGDDDSGRYYIEFEEPQQADLVQLQGANTQLIDETEVEVGEYLFLQLDVSDTQGVLADSGEEANVETPGEAPLKFNQAFEVREGERTTFVADFTPVKRGRTNSYIIQPVATGTRVLYGDEEYEPEGDSESTEDGTETDSDGSADGEGGAGGDGSAGGDGGRNGGADEETATATETPA